MKKSFLWLLPKRIDRYLIAVVILFLSALSIPELALLGSQLRLRQNAILVVLGPLAMISLLIASSLGIQPIRQVGRRWWLLISWLAVIGFLVWRLDVLNISNDYFQVLLILAGAFLVVFGISKLIVFLVGFSGNRFSSAERNS